ncbi:MAG: HDOD domain-containing protein [Chitinispirillaceae bacterium]|nr:HDOD domain-containing protein [Chitinispirillaceae bacterium]
MNSGASVTILLMTITEGTADTIQRAMSSYRIVFVKSNPSYANYLKILQYKPDAIIMELPQPYHDQLHFIQLVKQHRVAGAIPIICFGDAISPTTVTGMVKIGINTYLKRPLDDRKFAEQLIRQMNELGITLSRKVSCPDAAKRFDIEQILSPQVPSQLKIDLMVKYVTETRAFPFTVSMALKLLGSEKSSATDLAKIIETDPALSASFLKKTNSVFFAGNNTRPLTMKEAIVRIGFTETRRIITGMAVMQLFDGKKSNPGFNRFGFWTHCLATAKIAEKLARLTGQVNADEAFLAGILHDFGIILFDEFFPDLFSRILQVSTDFGIRFYDAELEILTVSHNDLVRRIFTHWKMPDGITEAIVNHYTGLQPPYGSDGPEIMLTRVVAAANILAKTFQFGTSCDQFVTPFDNTLFSLLGITFGLPNNFYREINDTLVTYKRLFKVNDSPTTAPSGGPPSALLHIVVGIVKLTDALFHPIEEYLRISDYTVLPISPEEPLAVYHERCDVILIFADSTTTPGDLQSFTELRKRTDVTDSSLSDRQQRLFAPLIILSGKESPCFAAVNDPQLSQLPEAIDLRMLDMYFNDVINGKKIKALPWESLLKPAENNREQVGEWQRKIQTVYSMLQKHREQCNSRTIVSDLHKGAEKLLALAGTREKARDYKSALALVTIAAEYYRKSLLVFELSQCEKSITEKESTLGIRKNH